MKLIIHIGTHKTGTTSIQRWLWHTKSELIGQGVWYPSYSEILGENFSDHYAHHDLAKGIMGESKRFKPEDVEAFFRGLHQQAVDKPDCNTVLISAEPFLRGQLGNENTKWARIEKFQEYLSQIAVFKHVKIVVVFRNYCDYLESLYNEHVKVTNYKKKIAHFYKDFEERFQYRSIVESWGNHFSEVTPLSFEVLSRSGDLSREFLRSVLGIESIPVNGRPTGSRQLNASLPIQFVELKRLFNGHMQRSHSQEIAETLQILTADEELKDYFEGKRGWLSDRQKLEFIGKFEGDIDWLVNQYGFEKHILTNPTSPGAVPFHGLTIDEIISLSAKILNARRTSS